MGITDEIHTDFNILSDPNLDLLCVRQSDTALL